MSQAERDTIAEREALEREEEEAAERERQRLEERKHVTRDLVAEQIAREDAAARAAAEVRTRLLHLEEPQIYLHALLLPTGGGASVCSLPRHVMQKTLAWPVLALRSTVCCQALQGPKEIGDIDTDDEKDEETQYEQWKSRELARIRSVLVAGLSMCMHAAEAHVMLPRRKRD